MIHRTVAALAAAALLTVVVSGCDTGPQAKAHANKGTSSHGTNHAAKSDDATPPAYRPVASDFSVQVKTTSKQCFGSAGCNIEYDVVLGATPQAKHLTGDWDVRYKVTGGDSGPIIDTIEVHPNGKYDVPFGGYASTSSSYDKLNGVVLGVSKHQGF